MTKRSKKHKKRTKRAKKELLVIQSPASPELKIAIASELADDQMIEAELMGEVLPHFIYEFPQEGKIVRGLSVKGVSEVVRRLNKNNKSGSKIRISPQHLTKEEKEYDGEKGIEVSVFAEDLVTGNSAWGIKFEPYKKMGKNGAYKNTFAVEKALSKAERNAKRKLIPEVAAVKMIEKLIGENPQNVRRIEPPKATTAQAQPSKTELFEQAKKVIQATKNKEVIFAYLERIEKKEGTENYTKQQLLELNQLLSRKLDELENPK